MKLHNPILETSRASFSIFIVISTLVLIIFRVLYSTPIEFNTESFFKFAIGQEIAQTNNWGLLLDDHHTLRWSVIIPQVIISTLFPYSYTAYYITPILFFVSFSILCTFLNSSTTPWSSSNIALLAIISCDPMTHVMASQLNSEGFGLLYAGAGFLLAHKYATSGRWLTLAISSLLLFLAYGAKAYFLVFAAGPLLYFLFFQKNYHAVAILLGSFLVCTFIESLALYIVSDGEIVTGRVLRILETHPTQNTSSGFTESLVPGHFLVRWRLLPKFNVFVLVLFIFSASLFASNKSIRTAAPPAVLICFLAALMYVIAISFPISGIDPLRLVVRLQKRYLAPFFPLALVVIFWLMSHIIQRYSKITQLTLVSVPTAVVVMLFSFGSTSYRCHDEIGSITHLWSPLKYNIFEEVYCRVFRHSQEQNIYPSPDAFMTQAENYYRAFNQDYLAGVVSLGGDTRVGVFKDLIRAKHPEATFIENESDWYSVNGETTDWCITELGQTDLPQANYRNCPELPETKKSD
jgi:hypothetical protein